MNGPVILSPPRPPVSRRGEERRTKARRRQALPAHGIGEGFNGREPHRTEATDRAATGLTASTELHRIEPGRIELHRTAALVRARRIAGGRFGRFRLCALAR